MAHSLGTTGAAYASGVRVLPGGSAFTLTGVFVDRITPHLARMSAMARASATQINMMGGRLTPLIRQHHKMAEAVSLQARSLEAARLQANRLLTAHSYMYGQIIANTNVSKAERREIIKKYTAQYKAAQTNVKLMEEELMWRRANLMAIEQEIGATTALGRARASIAYYTGGAVGVRSMARTGLSLAGGATLGVFGGYGLPMILGGGAASEYTAATAQVAAIGRFNAAQRSRLSEYIQGLGPQLAMPQESMMAGSLTLVRAGLRDVNEIQRMLVPGIELAITNAIELEDALRNILVVQNAFNLSRDTGNEIAANQQILINQSLMDFSDYVDGMKYSIAWADKLGLSYQQTSAAIATMTDAGIRAGIGGRGMRRMFSKFADDLEIIQQKLERGGSSLEVFSEDGTLNLSALLHELGSMGTEVEQLEFALDRFGLRGSTAFLTLAAHADHFDEMVNIQTGDYGVLQSAAETAMESIQAQMQLLKNSIKNVFLDEKFTGPLTEMVRDLIDSGKLDKLIKKLREFFLDAINFMTKEGGLEILVDLAVTWMGVMVKLARVLQPVAKAISSIAGHWQLIFGLMILRRMQKATSLMHQLAAAILSVRLAQTGGTLGRGGMIAANLFGLGNRADGGAMAIPPFARSGAGMFGASVAARGGMMAGVGGMGMAVPLIGLAIAAGVGAYYYGKHQKEEREKDMKDLLEEYERQHRNPSGYATGSHGMPVGMSGWTRVERDEVILPGWQGRMGRGGDIIINGDVYGYDDFVKKVQEANTKAYNEARRRY